MLLRFKNMPLLVGRRNLCVVTSLNRHSNVSKIDHTALYGKLLFFDICLKN